MAEVLGRILAPAGDEPRGPDVLHGIRVKQDWLEEGRLVEFELPRNLTCAVCHGGGCDRCDRAGAVTLRGRTEMPEVVQITLPRCPTGEGAEPQSIVLRIPDRGGLPLEGSSTPRGLLLLKVSAAVLEDRGVRLAEPPQLVLPLADTLTVSNAPIDRPNRSRVLGGAILFFVLWLTFIFYLRATGKG